MKSTNERLNTDSELGFLSGTTSYF